MLPPNTELGVVLVREDDEPWHEFVERVAVSTLYAARDRGLKFELQAKAVADVVLLLAREHTQPPR